MAVLWGRLLHPIFMTVCLLLLPALVGGGVLWYRSHALGARLEETRGALGTLRASSLLSGLSHDYPNHPEVAFLQARQARLAGEYEQSLAFLKEAERLGWPDVQIRRETLLVLGHNDFKTHQDELMAALDREPSDRDLILTMARGYLLANYLDRTESLTGFLINRNPDDRDARFLRARAYFNRRQFGDAEEDLEKALAGGADSLYFREARLFQGATLLELGQFERALKVLEECRADEPERADVLYDIGQAEKFLGHTEESLAAFGEAYRRNSKLKDSLLHMADLYEARRDLPNALQSLEAYEKRDPSSLELLFRMARVLSALEQKDRAHKYQKRYDETRKSSLDVPRAASRTRPPAQP